MNLVLQRDINASADKVWQILAHDFAKIADWSTDVGESRELRKEEIPSDLRPAAEAAMLGRYTSSRFVKAKEVLTEYSEENKSFTFTAIDLLPIFSSTINQTSVKATGSNSSNVTFEIDIQFKGIAKVLEPLLKSRMQSSGPGKAIQELKHYAEKIT